MRMASGSTGKARGKFPAVFSRKLAKSLASQRACVNKS